MTKDEYQTGLYQDHTPFVTFGQGKRKLVILEDLRVEHELPRGMALQGLRDSWADLSPNMEITLVSRPKNLKEGTSQEDFAQDLLRFIDYKYAHPVELLALGVSVPTALEACRIQPTSFSRLWLVSGAPKVSDSGRVILENVLEAGRNHRWGRVHGALAATMFTNPLGKFMGGAMASLFATDLGSPEDPWDFLVTLQAILSWNPQPLRLQVPMNIWVGKEDPLFHWEDWDAWMDVNPDGVLEISPGAHGLMKTKGDAIRQGIFAG